jgi:hypothetical protein
MTTPRFTTPISATGPDANIYSIVGHARQMMRDLGVSREDIEAFSARVYATPNYAAALEIVREWFPEEGSDR